MARSGRNPWVRRAAVPAAVMVAGALAERRHLKRIAADPQNRLLRDPPHGEPVPVVSADGTAIHAERFGPVGGLTFVLAHGWTESATYWTPVIARLTAAGAGAVAYDLRGHGESAPATGGDYSLPRFGEDLDAVLDQAGAPAQRTVAVGHSLGAMSIVAWAEQHDVRDRVAAAALLNTGVGDLMAEHLLMPVPAVAKAVNRVLAPDAVLRARAPVPRFSTPLSSAMIRYTAFGPSASPAEIAFYERMLVACPPDVRADVGLAISEMDLYHALPMLTVPTLVIAGENDRLTPPSHAQRIAEQLPALHGLVILPRTGHMGPLERPDDIAEALLDLAGPADKSPINQEPANEPGDVRACSQRGTPSRYIQALPPPD